MVPPDAINEGAPVTPRPAATVLLLRDRDPWELLMVQRPGGADFAPGAYVFPGGAVQEEDRAWDDAIGGAAIRETFEETGVLLARTGGRLARDAECIAVRSAIAAGTPFAEAIRDLDLTLAFDELVMFARWVTPAQLRRRFDTRFFLARLPQGQTVHPQEGEVTAWLWIDPRRALDSAEITLVYATRAILESVGGEPDASKLFARARAMSEIPIVEPRIVRAGDGWTVVRD